MATLKQRLHRKNAAGTFDTVHLESSSNLILRPSGRTVEQDLADYLPRVQNNDNVPQTLGWVRGSTKAFVNRKSISFDRHTHEISQVNNLQNEINSLKTSVSNGKSAVASAITDKGVSTSATATFDTMAANIRAISSLKSETRVIEHNITWPNQTNPYRVDITFDYSPLILLVNYQNVEQEMGCVNFFLQQGTQLNILVKSPGSSWNGATYLKCLLSGNTAYVCDGDYMHIGASTIYVTFISYYR